jgi:hypothetical protein
VSRASKDDVMRFIRAVCPEAPELYLASFDEKKALNDAAQLIEDLQIEVAGLHRQVEAYRSMALLREREANELRTALETGRGECEHNFQPIDSSGGMACVYCNQPAQR